MEDDQAFSIPTELQPRCGVPAPSLRVAGIFCSSNVTAAGREMEKLADCEVFEVAKAIKAALEEKGHRVDLVNLNGFRIEDLRNYDWVFNLAESVCGFPYADYEIARLLETSGIGFTGSGSSTLRFCLDKALTKAELGWYGITTPAYEVYHPGDPIRTGLLFPLFVKPVHEDGSIGIADNSNVRNEAELTRKVQEIHRIYQQAALVEEYIEGRDIAASILGNSREAVVMPLTECVYLKREGPKFLTFESKWVTESNAFQASVSVCPAELDPEVEQLLKVIALRSYQIMGCRDYARVDFRLKGEVPYVLEVNPNPCINPDDSGYVKAGKAAGFSYGELVNRILDVSVGRRNLS
jgi:D-alanine-D-alanine ligase